MTVKTPIEELSQKDKKNISPTEISEWKREPSPSGFNDCYFSVSKIENKISKVPGSLRKLPIKLTSVARVEWKPQLDPKLEKRFNELAFKWQDETCGYSSITKKITNINYLKIIAMGKEVVPLILRSIEKQPNHWFVALKALTDQDPTNPNDSFEQAVEAWINWGKSEGLID